MTDAELITGERNRCIAWPVTQHVWCVFCCAQRARDKKRLSFKCHNIYL